LNECLEHCYLHSEKYQEAGILIEDLSEDDILNVVLELESRLNNSWVDFNGNEEFENKFWRVLSNWKNFSKYHGWLHPEARVGSYFLNKVGSEFFN
ncbi:glycosyltransferase, TIGR04372 family protein, partial [Leptospira santarosai]|nr:glycosyltransferase, TIGR04372 family protein [Leptospira santarosai]